MYPGEVGLIADLAELAIATGNWSEASSCAHAILDAFDSKPGRP
jgi:hypothetical protein